MVDDINSLISILNKSISDENGKRALTELVLIIGAYDFHILKLRE